MFRKIKPSDREEFIAMSREFYNSEAVLNNIDDSFHAAAFEELMRSEDYLVCYIFEQEDKTAGYAMLNKSFSHEVGGMLIWLEELYIRKEYQGRGLGSGFLDWMAENVPAARFRLETEPENERAYALYKKKGYGPIGYVQLYKDIVKE